MRELLDVATESYGIVLVDTPPVLPYVDAVSLAQWADGIVIVVMSRATKVAAVRDAVSRLEATGVPIVGTVLNAVDPIFLDRV